MISHLSNACSLNECEKADEPVLNCDKCRIIIIIIGNIERYMENCHEGYDSSELDLDNNSSEVSEVEALNDVKHESSDGERIHDDSYENFKD